MYDYAFSFDDPQAIHYVPLVQWGFQAVAKKYNLETIKASDGMILGVSFPEEPTAEMMEDVRAIMQKEQAKYLASQDSKAGE